MIPETENPQEANSVRHAKADPVDTLRLNVGCLVGQLKYEWWVLQEVIPYRIDYTCVKGLLCIYILTIQMDTTLEK